MGQRSEEIFDAVLEQALEKARDVDCSPAELMEGIRGWVERLELEIDEVESTTR